MAFFDFLSGSKNPADDAMPYLDQIPDTLKPYYDPYIDAGGNALSTMEEQYQTLLNDPDAMMRLLGERYQQSPGYQFQMNQGMNAATGAAAAGGMAGTPYHQNMAANMASNYANQDYYDFMDRGLNQYQSGLGVANNVNQMGYGASNELANSLGNNLMNQANMSYLGTANQNQANADRFGAILKGATALGKAAIGIPGTS